MNKVKNFRTVWYWRQEEAWIDWISIAADSREDFERHASSRKSTQVENDVWATPKGFCAYFLVKLQVGEQMTLYWLRHEQGKPRLIGLKWHDDEGSPFEGRYLPQSPQNHWSRREQVNVLPPVPIYYRDVILKQMILPCGKQVHLGRSR